MSGRVAVDGVGLWWIRLPEPDPRPVDRLRAELDRRATARHHLRLAVATALGVPVEQLAAVADGSGRPPGATGAGNRPAAVSLSRTAGRAVAAVSTDVAVGGRIGVDVERINRTLDFSAIARQFFTAAEVAELAALSPADARLRFYRMWTWKEATAKAGGTGFTVPLPQRDATRSPGAPHAVTVEPEPGYLLTLVTPGPPDPLRWHEVGGRPDHPARRAGQPSRFDEPCTPFPITITEDTP